MSFELNPAQEVVASTLRGRMFVSAGAGTGKTRALTERFVRAATPPFPGVAPAARVDEVLTITFTEKAAGEIAGRIRAELREAGCAEQAELLESSWISTIHGFGRRLLRRHAVEAGLDPLFSVADDVAGGFLRDEALERALSSALERCDREHSFIEAYGARAAGEALRRVSQELRARGLNADALIFEPTEAPGELRREAISILRESASGFSPHTDASKGAAQNHAACVATTAALEELDTASADPHSVALLVWRAVSVDWPAAARAVAVRECASLLTEAREDLAARAAAIVLEPLLHQLRDAVAEYLAVLEEVKRERGILDFDDLQLLTRELLLADDGVRDRYRRAFSMVMVDEFQDTDEVQASLIEAVADDNLCTVGDERQSIYGFRGADVDVYRRHRSEMRSARATEVDLVENYRSCPEVIAFVNRVFGSGELFGSDLPPLVASREEPGEAAVPYGSPRVRIELVRADGERRDETDRAEADAVAGHFSRLREQGQAPGDMVVLVRTYKSATPVAEALQRHGFDVEVVGGSRFFGLREVAVLRDVCAVIANPYDDTALARLLVSDLSAVSDEGALLLSMARTSENGPRSLWDALSSARELLEGRDAGAACRLRRALKVAMGRAAEGHLVSAVGGTIEDSGLDLLYAASGREGEQAFENIQKFLRKIEVFERSGESGASAFVARLEAEERFGSTESPAIVVAHDSSAVRIMSIHASKGLEFPVVAIVCCADGPRPPRGIVRTGTSDKGLRLALDMPKHLAGEGRAGYGRTAWFTDLHDRSVDAEAAEMKRQFYVACTRAQEVLVLSGVLKGEKSPEEMGESPLAWCRRALPALRVVQDAGTEVLEFDTGRLFELTVRGVETIGDAHEVLGGGEVEEGPPATRPEHDESEVGCEEPEERRSQRIEGGVAPVPPERLSATDIALYDRCPLRYWAERVAGFGDVRVVADGAQDPLAFGSALHALLQLDRENSRSILAARVLPIALHYGLDPSGVARLERAFRAWCSSATRREFHEQERVWTEYPFALPIGCGEGGGFDLVGAIDAWGRSGDDALLVDYKTGAVEAEEVELLERYAIQARIYAYAVLREGCRDVRVRFVRPEVVDAAGTMQHVEFAFGPADMPRIEEELVAAHRRVAGEHYRPLTRWEPLTCGMCRIAGGVCPVTPPRRAAG